MSVHFVVSDFDFGKELAQSITKKMTMMHATGSNFKERQKIFSFKFQCILWISSVQLFNAASYLSLK